MNEWLRNNLVCPQDKNELEQNGDQLTCADGHEYSIVDDIPVMLFDDGSPTHGYITRSLEQVERVKAGEPLSEVFKYHAADDSGIDTFVQREVPYTCGTLYFSVQHHLPRYPFPEIRLPEGNGRVLLDVGCNWGRWTIPAAQKGFQAFGIDPSLEAVRAARRVAKQLGAAAGFCVADARYLPFAADSVDLTFSYGVIQHLTKPNAKASFAEMSRVTKTNGTVVVQMANKYGIRSFYHQVRLGFKDGQEGADVFYWTPAELLDTFEKQFGTTQISTDCYFGLGIQKSDADLMPAKYRAIVNASEVLRSMSAVITPLTRVADSVYLESINQRS
ncbi:MAG: class I SAM-dependent methyltransferase [Acidobacteriota bacterium]